MRRSHTAREVVAATAGAVALAGVVILAVRPAPAQPPEELWRQVLVSSGPTDREEPPHPEATHEWWYFTVQSPGDDTGCGPWQAMVSFVADREVVKEQLLFTAVVGDASHDFSEEFPPGSLTRSRTDAGPATHVSLGGSRASGAHPRWSVHAETARAVLDLDLDATGTTLWRRRAPEGWGVLEITFAVRAAASGSLRLVETGRTCTVTGTGYYEHVWGHWSRVPMSGVDFLDAHFANGWAAYARHTPMRGENSLYRRLERDPHGLYPSALIVFDDQGRAHEAQNVVFTVVDSAEDSPLPRVRLPARLEVTGTIPGPGPLALAPRTFTLTVTAPRLATVLFPLTSSGILEGWGTAELAVSGLPPASGTSEVELQRFGTIYPG